MKRTLRVGLPYKGLMKGMGDGSEMEDLQKILVVLQVRSVGTGADGSGKKGWQWQWQWQWLVGELTCLSRFRAEIPLDLRDSKEEVHAATVPGSFLPIAFSSAPNHNILKSFSDKLQVMVFCSPTDTERVTSTMSGQGLICIIQTSSVYRERGVRCREREQSGGFDL
jgi:hypothetical protein